MEKEAVFFSGGVPLAAVVGYPEKAGGQVPGCRAVPWPF